MKVSYGQGYARSGGSWGESVSLPFAAPRGARILSHGLFLAWLQPLASVITAASLALTLLLSPIRSFMITLGSLDNPG